MPLAQLIALLQIALPGVISVYHIIHDRKTGATTVISLTDDAVQAAGDTKDLIAAWQAAYAPDLSKP